MDNEQKRKLLKDIAPEIKKLIKKYSYEAVNYAWQQEVVNQRRINKLDSDIKKLQKQKESLQS